MSDDWEQQRNRAIMAAFQTGRPVFADSNGEMRFADGERESLDNDAGTVMEPAVAKRKSWWRKLLGL